MERPNTTLRTIFCLIAVAVLAQCGSGKKSLSQETAIDVIPPTPIVINADIESPSKKAPWFEFDVEITNNSDKAFEIVAVRAEVTGADTSGSLVTQDVAWSPSEFNYSTDTTLCSYTTYGIWLPTQTKKLKIYDQAGVGCAGGTNGTAVRFNADNNTKPATTRTFRYKVKLEPLGYFLNDQGEPDARYDKTKTFYTR